MRLLLGTFVPPLLIVLLAVTTPLGTGEGVHQTDLLHPLVPHVHLLNGRVISHQAVASGASADNGQNGQQAGAAVGGGAGSDAASVGLGLSPTVPGPPQAALVGPSFFFRRTLFELSIPTGRVEAPPDPPPTSAA